jgi:hypothetical protein
MVLDLCLDRSYSKHQLSHVLIIGLPHSLQRSQLHEAMTFKATVATDDRHCVYTVSEKEYTLPTARVLAFNL